MSTEGTHFCLIYWSKFARLKWLKTCQILFMHPRIISAGLLCTDIFQFAIEYNVFSVKCEEDIPKNSRSLCKYQKNTNFCLIFGSQFARPKMLKSFWNFFRYLRMARSKENRKGTSGNDMLNYSVHPSAHTPIE